MTKRRPTNKKPTGANRSLGNCLSKECEKSLQRHRKKEEGYGAENITEMNKNAAQIIESVTDETGLEEFLAKVELAGTNFAAERDFRLLNLEGSKTIVNTVNSAQTLEDLYSKYGDRLRIPRRPSKHMWETPEDLIRLENNSFLEWRKNLADLQESDGVLLTPYERNLEVWRQLWRVIERSDIIVQILDARNPLLFRNIDLEAYVKECNISKQNLYLINKVDLLSEEQIESWRNWFAKNNMDAVFWSALDSETVASVNIKGEFEDCDSNESSSNLEFAIEKTHDEAQIESSEKADIYCKNEKNISNCKRKISGNSDSLEKIPVLHTSTELLTFLKSRGHIREDVIYGRPLVIGMVGYPNVGKSSTINKILNQKKVSVSATPGKTRHLQTLLVDDTLVLCDCPGLVMPSFALSRSEMILNGILSIDHMREYISPVTLLLSRIPRRYLEHTYSVMLTSSDSTDDGSEAPLSAHDLLTAIAFIRGYMSSSGVADCSRAARLVLKDVVNGKVKWVAAPPNIDQKEFDKLTYDIHANGDSMKSRPNKGIMQQLEKRHLLQDMKASDKSLDEQFFHGHSKGQAHIRSLRSRPKLGLLLTDENVLLKKHFNKGRKAIIVKAYDEGSSDRAYSHAVIAGIDKYPLAVTKRMGKKKIKKRSKLRPFVGIASYSNLLPTRYSVDVVLDKSLVNKEVLKEPGKKRRARMEVKSKFEERYKTGKNRWFFTKLRF
ncbi:unnamed protein product [Thelazia callipaeda]|uniref:60S ribosomal protein L27 n=1 Tax=Thelazia callipaeda TaxID=103827 RepID=A0A158RCX6_THECL|nr:unnamed protein product [Thelazia callipaeda]